MNGKTKNKLIDTENRLVVTRGEDFGGGGGGGGGGGRNGEDGVNCLVMMDGN